MAKIDLDAMSIEELAALRDNATAKLLEKVAARQLDVDEGSLPEHPAVLADDGPRRGVHGQEAGPRLRCDHRSCRNSRCG